MFADDTNIYYENESFKELEKIVNKELKNLYLWLSINRLALNIEKTTFLIFHPFNKPLKYNVTVKIHKKAILEKQNIKYLGIIVDSTLSWKAHLSNLSNKLSRTIGVMYKLNAICEPANYEKHIPFIILFSSYLWHTSMG